MTKVKRIYFFLSLLLLLGFSSCSARIEGELKEGGVVDLSLKSSLEPRMIGLIRSLRGFLGESSNEPILDAAAMSRTLAVSPGVRSVSLRNTTSTSVEGTISISKIEDFLAAKAAKTRFISYTEGRDAGTSSITLVLNRDSVPELIAALSPEAGEYLEALMAPAVLGETSTKQEYLQLISAVYGRPLADEIAASRIKASVDFPRPVTVVRGGTASGRRVEFDIPLLDILVLEQPIRYEVSW
jgi:hypothetical protein